MAATRRKTDIGGLVESFLDEHEDDLSANLWNALEDLAEEIDNQAKALEKEIEDLEEGIEELEEDR